MAVPDARVSPRRFAGLHPLLFAAYPVLFLWSQNLGETDPLDVIAPLVVLVGGAAALTILAGRVLGDIRRGALIVTPLVLGLLMYGHLASNARELRIPALLQQIGWVVLVVSVAIAAIRLSMVRIAALDRVLTGVGLVLTGVSLALIGSFLLGSVGGRLGPASIETPSGGVLPMETEADKRDVYHIVLDRYGSDRGLELAYGVRNDLTTWLRDRGFVVLDDSHANYIRTGLSLPTTYNMQHLRDLAPDQGPESTDLVPVYDTLKSSRVTRQFQALGYRYVHIGSVWGPLRSDPSADRSLVLPGPPEFVTTLYDASALPALLRRVGIRGRGTERDRHYAYNEFALDALDEVQSEPGPKFVRAHIVLPHPPYVFDRDGRYMSAEESDALPRKERFVRQLDYVNSRIRALVERLLALPEDERPIIILQGDEGPWSLDYRADIRSYDWGTASPEALESKFGILNAWHVPGDTDLDLEPGTTAINTFPILFDRYFGVDHAELPDRVFTSRDWNHPYDLTEITARLPSTP